MERSGDSAISRIMGVDAIARKFLSFRGKISFNEVESELIIRQRSAPFSMVLSDFKGIRILGDTTETVKNDMHSSPIPSRMDLLNRKKEIRQYIHRIDILHLISCNTKSSWTVAGSNIRQSDTRNITVDASFVNEGLLEVGGLKYLSSHESSKSTATSLITSNPFHALSASNVYSHDKQLQTSVVVEAIVHLVQQAEKSTHFLSKNHLLHREFILKH